MVQRYQVSVYLDASKVGQDPPTYQTDYNTVRQGIQEALKHLDFEPSEKKIRDLCETLESDGLVSIGTMSGVHIDIEAFDPLNPPAPPGQAVYIVREDGSPCDNYVCAAFSTHERAQKWLELAAKNMGADPESLFIDKQVLNMASPKIF